jgi:hypothetical protein
MEWLKTITESNLFKTSEGVAGNILNFVNYLISLFMKNPLWFLGGLVILRASQKGVKFNLKDLFKFDLD